MVDGECGVVAKIESLHTLVVMDNCDSLKNWMRPVKRKVIVRLHAAEHFACRASRVGSMPSIDGDQPRTSSSSQ